jgi:hypothetical protein
LLLAAALFHVKKMLNRVEEIYDKKQYIMWHHNIVCIIYISPHRAPGLLEKKLKGAPPHFHFFNRWNESLRGALSA